MSKEYTAFNGDAFWNDGYVQELDMVETAVYFHYITSPRLENSGVFKEGQQMVSFYIKADIETVKNADAKLEKDGKIYRIGEWVIVPSSLKHQKFDKSPNTIKSIYEQLKTVPVEVLNRLRQCEYKLDLSPILSTLESDALSNPSDTLPEPLPNPSETHPLYSDSDSDSYSEFEYPRNNIRLTSASPPEKNECDFSEPQKLFVHIWQTAPGNVFNSLAGIEKPKEWARFWSTSPPSCEEVRRVMQNVIDDVNCGALERRYIPRTPDRFVLGGGFQRHQARYKPDNKKTSPPPNLAGKKSLGGLET